MYNRIYCTKLKMVIYFFKALLIGMSVAAIVGPISLYFINRTLQDGIKSATAIGLGTAFADGIFGLIAAMGITGISHFLSENGSIFEIAGGIFLLYIAYNEIKKDSSAKAVKVDNTRYLMLKIFLLTLANPLTIASFVAIFATVGGGDVTILEGLVMAIGCFFGSVIWWIILGGILLKTKHKLSNKAIDRIRVGSSLIITAFGIFGVISGLVKLSNSF